MSNPTGVQIRSSYYKFATSLNRNKPKNSIKIRQTVLKNIKEQDCFLATEAEDGKWSNVKILTGTEGLPNDLLAPSKARVTERELVGVSKWNFEWKWDIADKVVDRVDVALVSTWKSIYFSIESDEAGRAERRLSLQNFKKDCHSVS